MTAYRKKLIEVALPLEDINRESAREKSIRHGHPSTLHLWWARRPLAACRAVLFASLVDDPSEHPDDFPTEEAQQVERERLFEIIRELVKWDNVSGGKAASDPEIMARARAEIMRSTNGNPPPVLDPFCGGGSIPLEAQRLGLEAHASDLNPVAVLITQALIEIPPKFAGLAPVHPQTEQQRMAREWRGAQGLAEDVRYYGQWMRDRAIERIGHLYPKVRLPAERGGGEATVIAWLWARTVTCPNPACGARMPLVRSFALSTKKGKETWVEPVIDRAARTVSFTIRSGSGSPPEPPKVGRGATFRCLVCENVANEKHIKAEAMAGRMSAQLMAIVAEGKGGRIYLPPTREQEVIAAQAKPDWGPDALMPDNSRWFSPPAFGMTTFADLFTSRQLVALTTFSDLVSEAREQALRDAVAARMPDDGMGIDAGGRGAVAYADAVATYLGLAVDRSVDRGSTICSWDSSTKMEALRNTFARQAIPMTWDFAEGNLFSSSSGNWLNNVDWTALTLAQAAPLREGETVQQDATSLVVRQARPIVSTDPPYYDNIGYADLSDFFYVWLRRSLQVVYPGLFGTMLVPKAQELVATPYRFDGSKVKAQQFFEEGLGRAFSAMRTAQHPDYPLTVYYAFKQAESEGETDDSGTGASTASTGWETMLSGLIDAGFTVNGTWPMRSEMGSRMVASGTNALASSIVLVCRPRLADAPTISRSQFRRDLRRELPTALRHLQQGNIAPVDLAQAAIGPGMAVYSRCAAVLEADGSPLRVRTALALINEMLDEVLAEQEGEFDADTRWAVTWYAQYGLKEAQYGTAETLSKAKNTSIRWLVEAGIITGRSGIIRLRRRDELDDDWEPEKDDRISIWRVMQQLIQALEVHGEVGAGQLLQIVGDAGHSARDLAYRLYLACERRGDAQEAQAYNTLVVSWPEIVRSASSITGVEQATLF